MVYLIFDTNIWLYLAQGEHPIVFEKLLEKINNKEIELLISEIQIAEWTRNKLKILNKIKEDIFKNGISAKNIESHLAKSQKKQFTKILNDYIGNQDRIIESAEKRFILIENLMKNKCIKIPITDDMKIEVIDWALNNKAPFHNNNNATADALILLSSVRFIELKKTNNSEIIYPLFVSNNSEEFSKHPKTDKDIIHPDFEILLASVKMKYERNLGKVLELTQSMIDAIDKYMDDMIQSYIDGLADYRY